MFGEFRGTLLRRVAVLNDFLLQWPDGLGGLPGVTPHTNVYFPLSTFGSFFFSSLCFNTLKKEKKNVDGKI